jgi:membrane protein
MPNTEPFAPFIARRLWGSAPDAHVPNLLRGRNAWLRHLARVLYAVVRDVVEGRLPLHAASLVYTTILSLVPLTALAFSVLKGFGVHYRFEPLLMSALAPLGSEASVIAERLLNFVDRMDVGVLGVVGLAMLFWTAISVVQKIEAAFNEIWHAHRARPLARKFTDYLSVLLIGPVLMFSAFGISASVLASETVRELSEYRPVWLLIDTAQQLVPFFLVVAAFTFIYKFLPYTRVNILSALLGGAIGGLIWAIASWAFGLFAQGASTYTAIYSAFASLILFIIWLDVNWLILLIGASFAFYHQHPEYTPLSAGRPLLSIRSRERLALGVIAAIGRAQYHGERPLSASDLRRRLRVPEEAVHRVLDALVEADLVAATADEPARYLPARPLESTSLKALMDAARRAGEQRGLTLERIRAVPQVRAAEARIDRAIAEALHGEHLKDLALGPGGPGEDADGTTERTPQPAYGTDQPMAVADGRR